MNSPRIFDCFIYFNEQDMLELRLRELYDYVDFFVLCEARQTHSGQSKRLFYEENKTHFEKYSSKIIHVVTDLPDIPIYSIEEIKDTQSGTWILEHAHRKAIKNGLTNVNDSDIILISDVDEVPNFHFMQMLPYIMTRYAELGVPVIALEQDFYYYNLNCYKGKWCGTVITWGFDIKEKLKTEQGLQFYRDNRNRFERIVNRPGWHLSYFMSPEKIMLKLQSFAHQEIIAENDLTLAKIAQIVNTADDIAGRQDQRITVMNDNYRVPRYHFLVDKCQTVGIALYTGEKFYQGRLKDVHETWAKDFKHIYYYGATPCAYPPVTVVEYRSNDKENWKSSMYKNFYGIRDIITRHPNIPFVCFGGCDVFIHCGNLMELLMPYMERYSENIVFASAYHVGRADVASINGIDVSFLPIMCGGSVIIMTNALCKNFSTKIEVIIEEWSKICDESERQHKEDPSAPLIPFSCDLALSYGLFKYFGIKMTPLNSLYAHQPGRFLQESEISLLSDETKLLWESDLRNLKGYQNDVGGELCDLSKSTGVKIKSPACFHYCDNIMRNLWELKNSFPFA